jgi:hypothetical protein
MPKSIGFFGNGLGNWVLLMPALAAIASMSDNGTIDICLDDRWRDRRRPAVEEICKAWPVINRVISWPKDRFNPDEYGIWYYSGHGNGSSPIVNTFLKRIKTIIPKPSWRGSKMHEADHYMEIARAQDFEGPEPKVVFPIADGPILDLPHPIIGLCNGWFRGTQYWEKKGWPYFERMSDVLGLYFGGSLVGIGLEGELSSDVSLDADYTGKLGILETARVISQLDLLITTDTGPMHIANLLGVSLIALFGPTLTTKNRPRGPKSTVITAGMECVPCQDNYAFTSCQKALCMEAVAVGDVMAVAREKLR